MTTKKLSFDREVFDLEIDGNYFLEAAQILHSRKGSTRLDIYSLFEKMGRNVTEMMTILENPESLKASEKVDLLTDVNKEFLINLAFLTKFLMPLIDQLDASIDKNIRVTND